MTETQSMTSTSARPAWITEELLEGWCSGIARDPAAGIELTTPVAPYDGRTTARVPTCNEADLDAAFVRARWAQRAWQVVP